MRRHLRRQRNNENSPKRYWLILPVIAFLALGQVIAANRLVALDSKLVQIRSQVLSLEERNEILKQKIASASALSTLEVKAEELKFTREPRVISLIKKLPVALDINR